MTVHSSRVRWETHWLTPHQLIYKKIPTDDWRFLINDKMERSENYFACKSIPAIFGQKPTAYTLFSARTVQKTHVFATCGKTQRCRIIWTQCLSESHWHLPMLQTSTGKLWKNLLLDCNPSSTSVVMGTVNLPRRGQFGFQIQSNSSVIVSSPSWKPWL